MRNGITFDNHVDENGNPTGGWVRGTGIDIQWQDGPLGRGAERKEPNGAFVEDVLVGCKTRIEFYQLSRFACETNARAIRAIEEALAALDERTQDREARQVEGVHEV